MRVSENAMRVSENPTATATLRVAREQADNAQLRSKKTSPDLNYTAESKSLQINKERLIVQENPGSTNRLHRRVPRPRLCFRTTRFSPITPNQQDSPILQGGCSADPEATLELCSAVLFDQNCCVSYRFVALFYIPSTPGYPPVGGTIQARAFVPRVPRIQLAAE